MLLERMFGFEKIDSRYLLGASDQDTNSTGFVVSLSCACGLAVIDFNGRINEFGSPIYIIRRIQFGAIGFGLCSWIWLLPKLIALQDVVLSAPKPKPMSMALVAWNTEIPPSTRRCAVNEFDGYWRLASIALCWHVAMPKLALVHRVSSVLL